ncbi:hypothetical protein FWK35_00007965 [Aphis craccivora]|uniref:Uncharacterized protein n=1 Tax=Aphis craccivora TaxID=307492 RepID=A0A6G0Z673_APHCR|nr:hypothetical protein FWK35_00007965 [Aphis craccivora]
MLQDRLESLLAL